jgi:hypothetical protein|tara:strand:- start:262 stop:729 length:468 start_codon:yes stop_codon:yes gene_type:complete
MQTKLDIKTISQQVQIIPVLPQEIDKFWGLVEFLIAEALKYGGSYADLKDIKEELIKDNMQLFIMFGQDDDGETKVFGCCTTRIFDNPNFKELQGCICTGKKYKMWVDQLVQTLENFAKINKCKRLNMLGRPGWKEFVKKHGWKVKHYQYQKEIN